MTALYIFYCDTALRQGTNKIHATTEYTSKGIGWGIPLVRSTKRKLIELGLIEEIKAYRSIKPYIVLKKFFEHRIDPIVIHRSIYRILVKEKAYSNLITLYLFYYDTAKWQKTNKPKVTNTYCCKGLNWGVAKQQITRTALTKLGYVEPVVITKNANGKLWKAHYVKVNFVWSLKKANIEINRCRQKITKYTNTQFIRRRKPIKKGVCKPSANAFSPGKINAYSPEKDLSSINNGFFFKNTKKTNSKNNLPISKICKYVDYWNSLPNTPKQKVSTKYYQKASKLLKELIAGTFIIKEKSLTSYCNQKQLPVILDKLTPNQIYKNLDKLALLFDEKYLPQDKSKLSKNLDLLIYNPYIKGYHATSEFLNVYFNDPKTVYKNKKVLNFDSKSNYIDQNQLYFDLNDEAFVILKKNRKIIDVVKEVITNKFLTNKEEYYLYKNLTSLIEFNTNLPTNPTYVQNRLIRNYYPENIPMHLIKAYVKYLNKQHWLDEIGINLFKPGSKVFKKFIKYEEENLQVSFKPTKYGAMRL